MQVFLFCCYGMNVLSISHRLIIHRRGFNGQEISMQGDMAIRIISKQVFNCLFAFFKPMQKDHIQINALNLTYKRCVRRTKRRLKKNKCIPDFGNDTGYSLAQINVSITCC